MQLQLGIASIDIDHTLQEVTLRHFYLCWQCCPPTYTSMHYMHYITATISNCVASRMHWCNGTACEFAFNSPAWNQLKSTERWWVIDSAAISRPLCGSVTSSNAIAARQLWTASSMTSVNMLHRVKNVNCCFHFIFTHLTVESPFRFPFSAAFRATRPTAHLLCETCAAIDCRQCCTPTKPSVVRNCKQCN